MNELYWKTSQELNYNCHRHSFKRSFEEVSIKKRKEGVLQFYLLWNDLFSDMVHEHTLTRGHSTIVPMSHLRDCCWYTVFTLANMQKSFLELKEFIKGFKL